MTDAPETLRQTFDVDGERVEVLVWREVAEDDLRCSERALTSEEFGDWWDANADRILRSALHKKRNVIKGELVAGPVWIKPGELLD